METLPKSTRKSLPLSAHDLEDLKLLKESPTYREALAKAAGVEISNSASEAAVLHAVWEAGLKAIREQIEDQGYAEMAAQQDAVQRQAAARRRRPSWADES